MRHASPTVGRRRVLRCPYDPETLASRADAGRHAAPDGDVPIHDALRDELAAVDWFSLGVPD